MATTPALKPSTLPPLRHGPAAAGHRRLRGGVPCQVQRCRQDCALRHHGLHGGEGPGFRASGFGQRGPCPLECL